MAEMEAMAGQVQSGAGALDSPGLPPRDEIAAAHLRDEAELVAGLSERAAAASGQRRRIAGLAAGLVRAARANRHKHGGVDAFMHEFNAERPHQALAMKCPAELYRASPRRYDGLP